MKKGAVAKGDRLKGRAGGQSIILRLAGALMCRKGQLAYAEGIELEGIDRQHIGGVSMSGFCRVICRKIA